jgi:N-acetylmuramoyl-L-alanine amidase
LHCSAAPPSFGADSIDDWHKARGFIRTKIPRTAINKKNLHIGYHFIIRPDGIVKIGRDEEEIGAHVEGFNTNSIGVCLLGIKDFTGDQMREAVSLCKQLMIKYKLEAKDVLGHYELDKHGKTCPNIDMQVFRQKLV